MKLTLHFHAFCILLVFTAASLFLECFASVNSEDAVCL